MTGADTKEKTTIVANGEGGLSFGETASEPPVAAVAVMAPLVENIPVQKYEEDEVVAEMEGWDMDTLDVKEPSHD